jgi:hypothetical protein
VLRFRAKVVAAVSLAAIGAFIATDPVLVEASGPAGACSAVVPSEPGHNGWAPAERLLAPSGVTAMRLCRYSTRLVRGVLVPSASLATVVREFDALRPAPDQRSFTSCPFEAAPIVAHLLYPGSHSVEVYVSTNGCVYANNGDVRRSEPAAARVRLRAALERLTAP